MYVKQCALWNKYGWCVSYWLYLIYFTFFNLMFNAAAPLFFSFYLILLLFCCFFFSTFSLKTRCLIARIHQESWNPCITVWSVNTNICLYIPKLGISPNRNTLYIIQWINPYKALSICWIPSLYDNVNELYLYIIWSKYINHKQELCVHR